MNTPLLDAALVVTLDNNVYRDLSALKYRGVNLPADVGRDLSRRDKAAGFQGLANPTVVAELVARLGDSEGAAFVSARDALTLLVEHCTIAHNGDSRIATLTDPISQLCRECFGEAPPKLAEDTDVLISLAWHIWETQPAELSGEALELAKEVSRFVAEQENEPSSITLSRRLQEALTHLTQRGAHCPKAMTRQR